MCLSTVFSLRSSDPVPGLSQYPIWPDSSWGFNAAASDLLLNSTADLCIAMLWLLRAIEN